MTRPALLALLLLATTAHAQSDAVRLNQVGFYPDGPKVAVVTSAEATGPFTVVDAGGAAVLSGTLGPAGTWGASGETVRQADFSALTAPGEYTLRVEGVGESHPFRVGGAVLAGVARAALKGYYFQRASTALDAEHAGPWARASGHPDTVVVVHPSAASPDRPAGTVISAPGGWYDAGDYNKYVVNSGISVSTLLSLYEWDPEYVSGLDVGIPESGDAVPDLVDEALYNVRWMLAMQDADGGVYHKLTSAGFSGEVLPKDDRGTRYVVQKSTPASLDFAATMAQAARVVADFPEAFPGLEDSLRTAAVAAWRWARANPTVRYDQAAMNRGFDPDISTGEYGDSRFDDEFDWAAMELYLTTRADSFLTATRPLSPVRLGLPFWGDVRDLGYYSLLANPDRVSGGVGVAALRSALLNQADGFVRRVETSPYGVPMTSGDFYWGSNSVAANQGVALMIAHRLTGEQKYLDAAVAALDYLLGRNATGYSFLTGVGDKTPLDPHHRHSRALRRNPRFTAGPVPGLLAGGPNPGQQDGCTYPSDHPARSYVDDWCSYASNEIAINWNAPLVALAASVESAFADRQPTSGEAAPRSGSLDVEAAPNPFGDSTAVRFRLAEGGAVTVRLFDALGREVLRLLDGAALGAGPHAVDLDGRDLPAGVYVVRVETAGGAAGRTITLAR